MLTRRRFSSCALAPLAAPLTPARKRALKRFSEIAASLYAWDLRDEGVAPICDTLAETSAVNSVYLVALMHHEKRPLTDFYYPHNPRRKTYFPEDSRAFWRPRMERYRDSQIKPLTSEREDLKGTDWLEMLVSEGRKRGWKTGAEISHTVLDKERARQEHVDAVQRDIYGNPFSQIVCPNSPKARAYLAALFTDLAANYDLDFVQTCLVPFAQRRLETAVGEGDPHAPGTFEYRVWGGGVPDSQAEILLRTVQGGCFCDSCHAEARRAGFDLAAARRALQPVADMLDHPGLAEAHRLALLRASNTTPAGMLLRHPELFEWLRFRRDSLTRLFAEVHQAVRAVKPKIDLRLNAYIYDNWELSGVDFAALKPYLGSVRSSNYDEQSGNPARMEHKRRFLLSVREAIGDEMHFVSAIGVRPKATPELVRKGVVISSECGADGLSLGHYDGAPLRNLEAIRQGLADADATAWRAGGRGRAC